MSLWGLTVSHQGRQIAAANYRSQLSPKVQPKVYRPGIKRGSQITCMSAMCLIAVEQPLIVQIGVTDLTAPKFSFRFAPESGLKSDIVPCPGSAKRRP
jgi:hypothetical protein